MIKILKTIFHIFILFLIVISLWPGSLFGILLYGNPNLQPNLAFNPFFTPVPEHLFTIASLFNHFIIYFFISMFGLCLYLRNRNFQKLAYGLFFLSIFLEVLQFMVPKRAFEILDLSANFAGVLLAYFAIKIYLFFNKL